MGAVGPRRAVALACALALASLASAQGGGPTLYEVGHAGHGALRGGGRGARARDAATAYTNPAGMTRLDGEHALFGLQTFWVVQEFEVDPTGTTSVPPGSTDGGGRSNTARSPASPTTTSPT